MNDSVPFLSFHIRLIDSQGLSYDSLIEVTFRKFSLNISILRDTI